MRLGIDIGGTFTDFVLIDDASGEVHVEKCLTTPAQPDQAVFSGIDRLAARTPDMMVRMKDVIHATTLVTNVIIERKGSKTGLITTRGFRDILELRREDRYFVFDMFIRFPAPLVPRSLRLGVTERVLADGAVLTPLAVDEVREAAGHFRKQQVGAVAVSFLHSYANPAHEKRVAEILAEEMPGVPVSLSHEVHPEPKEYERTSTTVVDAYVKRTTATYLEELAKGIGARGFKGRPFMMLSNGGTATIEAAKRFPVQILESGPAAGVEAASFFARLMGIHTLLSFDMGGTTAKLCIVEDGRAGRTREFEVDRVHRFRQGSGIPVSIPVYDLLELGAGGGSIARISDLGLLQVGPDSSGANPGPACYAQGGREPTVTDADLVLGYLNPNFFLGGEMPLDETRARRAIATRVAEPAGLEPVQAAAGIHELVNETMAAAARVYIAEKAKASKDLTLVACGGAGPLHAIGLARKLGCPRVIVPPYSGVLSSLGLLAAPIAFERSRAVRRLLRDLDPAALEKIFVELDAEIAQLMPPGRDTQHRRSLQMRYAGQDYALDIDVEGACTEPGAKQSWQKGYAAAYERFYGRVDDNNPVEVAAVRLNVMQAPPAPKLRPPGATADAKPKAQRRAWQPERGDFDIVPVYDRYALRAGQAIDGPAIIEERESTTVLYRGDRLGVHANGCLVIEVAAAKFQDLERDIENAHQG
ncbi:MAG: hydantoinase/oxoprolinase family protein [Alphaproteobacteria bacterium]|nr:hydantoinase/oxoprolinase family protein [Alphaproteobacteria bacterium]